MKVAMRAGPHFSGQKIQQEHILGSTLLRMRGTSYMAPVVRAETGSSAVSPGRMQCSNSMVGQHEPVVKVELPYAQHKWLWRGKHVINYAVC
jgi:hypothetical protein